MPDTTTLTDLALQHAVAQAAASTADELAQRTREASAAIAARAPYPQPLLRLLAAHAAACRQQLTTLADLRAQADLDPLTGIGHHRPLSERLAVPPWDGTAVFVIDVDSFKTVNDTHGHPTGDEVLVQLAATLQQTLPLKKDLYRIGGDEFVALATTSDEDAAHQLGQRLCQAAHQINLTVSVGIAIGSATESANATLHRADAALYAAKRAGGNIVCLAAALDPPRCTADHPPLSDGANGRVSRPSPTAAAPTARQSGRY